jgi:cytochrome c oxidase subunit IV
MKRLWDITTSPFRNWSSADYLMIGLAALILSVFARHVLHLELGYAILSWPGTVFVIIGLWRMFGLGE